jgi:lysophospholipase L1-like esterase
MLRPVLFRLTAGVLGIGLTLLVAEVALRIASSFVEPDDRTMAPIVFDDEIRISCIGESTTYGRWPAQLEELLNSRDGGPRFRVINRGVVGIRTDGVADRIETWLDEDRPQIVVTMLGINDEGNVLVYPRDAERPWWVEHLLTGRLLDLLWRSAVGRGEPEDAPAEAPFAEAHLDEATRRALGQLEARRPEAIRRFRISEMIEIHRALLVEDPGTPVYHLDYLIGLVLHHESAERIDEFFRTEIGVDRSTIDESEQERLIERWVGRTGDRFSGTRLEASIAMLERDGDRERSLLERPSGDPIVGGLLELRLADFHSRGRSQEAVRQHLLRADELLPDDYQWSLLQGGICFMLEAPDLASVQFERALRIRPDLPPSHELVLLGRLANASEGSGDESRAAELRARRDELELGRFREFTRYHYRRVVDAVRAREIPLIAMQYPLLSVASLEKLLDHRDDVIFLENRQNFIEALRTRRYRELFSDHFAGSFGHFTDDGNLLVAHNVAGAVRTLVENRGLAADDAAQPHRSSP